MDERLKQYLAECKNKKLTWEQVEHVLEGSNYPAETIAEANTWYVTPTTITEPDTPVKTVNEVKTKKKQGWGLWILIIFLIFGLLGSGGYGAIYMVGTQKLTLPNQNLQTAVEKIAMSVPGVPKNPKLILEMVTEAHKKVSKSSFEISMSGQLQASEIEALLGSKALDMQIKGYSDVTDTLDPKFSMNLIFGKEVDVSVVKPDKMMYVKVNKIPVALYALVGMDPIKIKPLWDNWIGMDMSKPDTSARQKLDEAVNKQNNQQEVSQVTQDIMDKIMTEEILPTLKITDEKRNGVATYKIAFNATPEQINKIAREIWGNDKEMSVNPSDILKSFNLEMWIDKKEMLVLEMDITGSVEMDKNTAGMSSAFTPVLAITSEKQKADVAIVIKMSDFGKDVVINKPDKYLSPEEFLSEFMKLEPGGIYGALLRATPSSSLAP